MEDKCSGCAKSFAAGDVVITFYFNRVLKGDKSGMLGFYEHPNSPQDSTEHVHFAYNCLEKCFSPVDNPFMYDALAAIVREEVMEDMACEEDFPEYEEDLPYCLWCKKTDTVWVQRRLTGEILTCVACNKLWDIEETELRYDPAKGEYIELR